MSKDDHDLIDEDSLSNLTVVDLREMCKNLQLMVSGNKATLIERIIESKGLEKKEKELETEQVLLLEDDEEDEEIAKESNIGDAVDKLISEKIHSNDNIEQINPTLDLLDEEEEGEILEAEIFVEEKKPQKIYEKTKKAIHVISKKMPKKSKKVLGYNFEKKINYI